MLKIFLLLARLSPVWQALVSFWRTPIGKGVMATMAALALVWVYGEWRAGQAVKADDAAERDRDAAVVEDRNRRLDENRRSSDDALIDRLARPR